MTATDKNEHPREFEDRRGGTTDGGEKELPEGLKTNGPLWPRSWSCRRRQSATVARWARIPKCKRGVCTARSARTVHISLVSWKPKTKSKRSRRRSRNLT